MSKICVCSFPIETSKEEAFKVVNDNILLTIEMNHKIKELEKSDVEIFYREKNLIATEKGYFTTQFVKDLIKVKEEVK